MGQGRRHFTDEFKQEAIALLVSSGRPLSQIASELSISPSMLRNWRNGSGGRDAGSALPGSGRGRHRLRVPHPRLKDRERLVTTGVVDPADDLFAAEFL